MDPPPFFSFPFSLPFVWDESQEEGKEAEEGTGRRNLNDALATQPKIRKKKGEKREGKP